MQPAAHSAVPSVTTSRSHAFPGTSATASVDAHPAGQSAELSVSGKRSHVRLASVAVPVQVAGTAADTISAVPKQFAVAVPVHVASSCAVAATCTPPAVKPRVQWNAHVLAGAMVPAHSLLTAVPGAKKLMLQSS